MTAEDTVLAELRGRLARYPADRYPVQHATTRFHLGLALLQRGRTAEASRELTVATERFDERQLPVEHAMASNMLGIALRERGDHGAARPAFEHAAALFSASGRGPEEAAARYNLGLVHAAEGDDDLATGQFSRALQLFTDHQAPGQASAAARELAARRLTGGHADEAVELFEQAGELAARAFDDIARGAAANGLGVALLAQQRHAEAGHAFRRALSVHPPTVRPAEHAMARANLALACERAGDSDRARLAARQALAFRTIPAAAADQARAVLARLPATGDSLALVLASEPPDDRVVVLRDEVTRWTQSPDSDRREGVTEWLTALEGWPHPDQLAEQWLGVLLELPPADLTAVSEATAEGLGRLPAATRERLRAVLDRAMARFPPPQWGRMRDIFAPVLAADPAPPHPGGE